MNFIDTFTNLFKSRQMHYIIDLVVGFLVKLQNLFVRINNQILHILPSNATLKSTKL